LTVLLNQWQSFPVMIADGEGAELSRGSERVITRTIVLR